MYFLEKSQTVVIDPKKAKALAELNQFEGQRPKNLPWIQHLATAMKNGSFTRAEIAVAEFNGKQVLMNGQHTLDACILSGVAFNASLSTYKCKVSDDVWHLFAAFDVHRARSDQNIMKAARGMFSGDLQAIPLRVLQIGSSALIYLEGESKPKFSRAIFAKSKKAELVQKFKSDIFILAGLHGLSIPLHVGSATAIITTHRAAPQHAPTFWRKYGPRSCSPRGSDPRPENAPASARSTCRTRHP